MKGFSNKLRFGSSYCPYAKSGDVDMSVWERDFKTMKELNFNALRCFVAWDRIEVEEGKFDFSKVDYAFELAEKYGIDMILNVGGVFATYGGIYPPRWLMSGYHCQEIVKDPQHPHESFGPYKELCPDDATYLEKAESFTVRMIKRYAGQKQLFGWNVWNEAYLKPECYCPLTLAKFRVWLKAKYQNRLDSLNSAWGTEFPVCYRTWEEIEPGLSTGFLASGCVARLDWLKFNQERVASWVEGVSRLVREHDALKRPTSSNIVTTTVYGGAEWHGRPDIWSQARSLDIVGFSFYTNFAPPANVSAGLASLRGCSNDPAKGFWVLETEAGQIANEKLYPPEVADGPRREATHWLSVLHGAKAILVWKFGGRVTDNQTEMFNLTAWDGSVTERARMTARLAKTYIDNEKLFLERSYKSEVAVLHSSDNALFASVINGSGDWQNARYGAGRLLRDLHIQFDCISDDMLRSGAKLSNFKVLILPNVISLDKPLADGIAAFIQNGGTVIADQRFGIFNENAVNLLQAPGNGLKDVFGSYVNDYLLGPNSMDVSLADGSSVAVNGNYRSILHLLGKSVEVLGRWPDGSPAISECKAGNGSAVHFGFQPFRDYESKPSAELASFFQKKFAACGVSSDYEVSGLGVSDDVEIGALTADDGAKTHFLINLCPKDFKLKLGVKGERGVLRDILSGESFDFSKGPCEVVLPAWCALILAAAE